VASFALVRLVVAFGGFTAAGVIAWIILVAILLQPRYGIYLALGMFLLFERSFDDPLMLPGVYFNNSLQANTGLTGEILLPFEILLLLMACGWLAHGAMRHRLDFRAGAFGRPVLLFGVALAFGIAHGALADGNYDFVLWEARYLVSMTVAYVLAANTIRTTGHVRTLETIVFLCAGLFAVEGLWRKFALIDVGALGTIPEAWYAHEDVVIWGMFIMLVCLQQIFGGPRWQRILGPPLALLTTYTMLISERRAGIIAVIVAMGALSAALFVVKRKAFFAFAMPVIIIGAIYMPLFWNSTSTLGQAARAVRSISDPDPRDAASNAWRDIEAINVRATILSQPLTGVGFGMPFYQVVYEPDISFFGFWNYEAHHNVLWVWLKTGAIGFVAFFIIVIGGIARSVWLARTLQKAELRVFAMLTMSTIIMSLVFCYVDIGLAGSRIPLILGMTLGTVGVLDRIN
jgi:hypothetical protein